MDYEKEDWTQLTDRNTNSNTNTIADNQQTNKFIFSGQNPSSLSRYYTNPSDLTQYQNCQDMRSQHSNISSLSSGTRQKKVQFSITGPLERNRHQIYDHEHTNYSIYQDSEMKEDERNQRQTYSNQYDDNGYSSQLFQGDEMMNYIPMYYTNPSLGNGQGSHQDYSYQNNGITHSEYGDEMPASDADTTSVVTGDVNKDNHNDSAQKNYFAFTRLSQVDSDETKLSKSKPNRSLSTTPYSSMSDLTLKSKLKSSRSSSVSNGKIYLNSHDAKAASKRNTETFSIANEKDLRYDHIHGSLPANRLFDKNSGNIIYDNLLPPGGSITNGSTSLSYSRSNNLVYPSTSINDESDYAKSVRILRAVRKAKMYQFSEDSDSTND